MPRLTLFSCRLLFPRALCALLSSMLLSPATAEPAQTPSIEQTSQDNEIETKKGNPKESQDQWGEITIAQPKIWQYERITALLDGLLRDVEGVSLEDLTRLNPSSQNAAAVKFIQSALGVSVTFDQAAQVNNRNTQQNFELQRDSQRQQLDRYNEYLQSLTAERNRLTNQLFAAQTVVDALQPLKDAPQITPLQQIHLTPPQTRTAAAQTA